MAQTIINKFGKVTGWNQTKFGLWGREVEGIKELSYKDNVEMETVLGAGGMPIGYGDGNYKAECGIVLLLEEWQAILAALPPGKRVHEMSTDLNVLMMRNGILTKDIVHTFTLLGGDVKFSQGDKAVWCTIPTFCTHITHSAK